MKFDVKIMQKRDNVTIPQNCNFIIIIINNENSFAFEPALMDLSRP